MRLTHGATTRLVNGKRVMDREYTRWFAMLRRCRNTKDKHWDCYGGRGITVCERWKGPQGYINFLHDMGPLPSSRHSLDRINNDGNYEPGNCRWATPREQNHNRRNTVLITHNGESHTIPEWAEILGCSIRRLYDRYYRGQTPEQILSTERYDRGTMLEHDGERLSVKEWAARIGIKPGSLTDRLKVMTAEEALTRPAPTTQPRDLKALTLTYQGETRSLVEWSEKTGIPIKRLLDRLDRGFSPEEILSPRRAGLATVEIDGQKMTVKEAARKLGIAENSLYHRFYNKGPSVRGSLQ